MPAPTEPTGADTLRDDDAGSDGPGHRSTAADAHVGRTLGGRYRLEGVLGEGGMGVVYRATDTTWSRPVAVKLLKAELAADKLMLDRFLNEVRAASSIGSAHVVGALDFGQTPAGTTYFVMELLEGRSLGSVLHAEGALPEARVAAIARQLAAGLAAAHAAGIVHRDLKPDNVMLVAAGGSPEFVKILDFGIAKVASRATRLTRVGSVFGTPHYMSPEQSAGLAVDGRADVYALGVIMHELASGRVPFDAPSHSGILSQHLYKAPARLRDAAPATRRISSGFEAIVLKCLTKKADGRYPTMEALAADLDLLARGLAPAAEEELRTRSARYELPADYFAPAAAAPPAADPGRAGRAVALGVGAGVALIAALAAEWGALRPSTTAARTPASAAAPSAPTATAGATAPAVLTALVASDPREPEADGGALPGAAGAARPRGAAGGRGGAAARPPATIKRADCFVDGKLAPFPECKAFAP